MKNNPINVGIIGLGRAGWGMHCSELDNFKNKFKIVAGCDIVDEFRKRFVEKYGCKVYKKVEELINDPDVELVDVASRSNDHVKHAIMALKANKYVFLEKPIATSYREALKIDRLPASKKKKLFVRHNRRFDPAFQHIKEIIDSGILGEVFEIKLHRNNYNRRNDWQTLKKYGGGLLLNWGPHVVDHALCFLQSPVKEMWSDLKRIAAAGDAEDHIHIILKGKNQRVVDLEISGGAAISEPEYLVLGTKGALECSGSEIKLRYLDPQVRLPELKANPGTPGMGFGSAEKLVWVEKTMKVNPRLKVEMHLIWDYLYESIRNNKPFPITWKHALEVMRIISEAKKNTKFR
ncbi:MAG TPA: Gfo/Idh/MocA family oxidoreductase [bacterium]|nr:Gfo/Idh/MocA family oxidoreductase [bacterium]HOL34608.1 Gfo/Idh/MocA family oxidoreductase [bacterium]HPP08146.1 Gfo/Idh/MocA family oxidoreductase [bacterium]